MNLLLLGLIGISTLSPLAIIWFAPESRFAPQVASWKECMAPASLGGDETHEEVWNDKAA